VQLVYIHGIKYITTSMGISEIWKVSKLPQPHLLTSHHGEMKVLLWMAKRGPAGKTGPFIRGYLASRAPHIFHHTYGALVWVVC